MCGIAGFVDFEGSAGEAERLALARRMTDPIRHRGPDAAGVWTDPQGGATLGHRRLSILDLSPAGAQPMISACERFVITFNGEIYNHLEIKGELASAGHRFRGSSDTEVLLAAIAEWGMERTLERLNGMFAFAVWDRKERRLHLARDRFGEKPLYYARAGKRFVFGSELKALVPVPGFEAEVAPSSTLLFLRYGYIPAPYTIYKDVAKLLPGSWMTVDVGRGHVGRVNVYWSARETTIAAAANPWKGSEAEAIDELDSRLRAGIHARMVSDVPLGAFLSGGIDSSAVVAIMQAVSPKPVRTFTIGFREGQFNEATYARDIARHLGTEHTELFVTAQAALDVIPRLPSMYDEPFADSSQLPTFLVSELARSHVTVALSGDGGDEVFGGYTRYQWVDSIWGAAGMIPRPLRHLLGRGAEMAGAVSRFLPSLTAEPRTNIGHRLRHIGNMIRVDTQDELYMAVISNWYMPDQVVRGTSEPRLAMIDSSPFSSITERVMLLDTVNYLPDDILVKLDRASMAVSLECRVPLLDAGLLEFAWRLPKRFRFREKKGKWILRRLLARYVPEAMFERPKMGFAIPLDNWLRGPLRDWAESLLDERRLRDEGMLEAAPVREKWREQLEGGHNGQRYLWTVLMFQAWLDQARIWRRDVVNQASL